MDVPGPRSLWRACVAALALVSVAQAAVAGGDGEQLFRDGHYDRALKAWEAEASKGDPDAAWRLAAALNDGVVVERDPRRAVRWLKVAADAGHAEAQLDLGTAYDRGEGVATSSEEAASWYHRAALQGHVAAQFNFASMCEQGQGVERDLTEAYAWYTLSVSQGIGAIGDEAIARVAARMSEAEVQTAAERAHRYEAAYSGVTVIPSAITPPR